MSDYKTSVGEDTFNFKSLKNLPKLSMSNWSTFSREFLLRTVAMDDAHYWLNTGKRPDIQLPDYNELVYELTPSFLSQREIDEEQDDEKLGLSSIIGEKKSEAKNETKGLPPGVRRRFPSDRQGEFMWERAYTQALTRQDKFRMDTQLMWTCLLGQMEKTVESKVFIHKDFTLAYQRQDIRLLWEIMHKESTKKTEALSKTDLYVQLISIEQKSSFDAYVIAFLDIVNELTTSFERPEEALLTQTFIKGLKQDEHRQWKMRHAGAAEADRPARLEDLIEDIKEYNKRLISYSVADIPLNNQKGAVRDGGVAAHAAVAGRDKGKGYNAHEGNKTKKPCWNCNSVDCPKGKRCKLEKSSYCKKCKDLKWHKTQYHDEWAALAERRGKKDRKERTGEEKPAATPVQPESAGQSPIPGRANPPAVFSRPPHLHYATQLSHPEDYPPTFNGLIPMPETNFHAMITMTNEPTDEESIYSRHPRVYTTLTAADVKPIDPILTPREYLELEFILDNGCVGGHLLTTPGAQALLNNPRRTKDDWINSVTGRIQAKYKGNLPLPGIAYYAPISTVNLLSLDVLEAHGLSYQKLKKRINLYAENGSKVILTASRNYQGHYTCTYNDLIEASCLLNRIQAYRSTTTTTAPSGEQIIPTNLSPAEMRRAQQAHRLHHVYGHPSDTYLIQALDNGNIRGCDVTSQDIRNMRALYGPCAACFQGKATLPANREHLTPTSQPGELIHIDLLQYTVPTVGGNTHAMVALDDYSEHILVIGMKNKSEKNVQEALKSIVLYYNQFKHKVAAFMSDSENTLRAAADTLNALGIRLHNTIPGLHEKKAERAIRTLKDKERTMKAALSYALPAILEGELRATAADLLNTTPNKSSGTRSPQQIVTGMIPPLLEYAFGQVGLFYKTTNKNDQIETRGEYGIVVGFNRDARNRYRVYFPFTGLVLNRGAFQPLEYVPQEWGWTQRLVPRQFQRAELQYHHSPAIENRSNSMENHPAITRAIQTGLPMEATPVQSPAIDPEIAHQQRQALLPDLVPIRPVDTISRTVAEEGMLLTKFPDLVPIRPVDTISRTVAEEGMVLSSANETHHKVDSTPPQESTVEPPIKPPIEPSVQERPPQKPRPTGERPEEKPPEPYITRSGRSVKPNAKYAFTSIEQEFSTYLSAYKVSVKQAMRAQPDGTLDAIKSEIDYMIKYEVMTPRAFEEIDPVFRKRAVPAHMFLKWKYLPNNQFDKIKARLVAGGNWQIEGTFGETNAPTINPITVNTLINITTTLDLECNVVDIKGAFLSAPVLPEDPDQYIKLSKEVTDFWVYFYPAYREYVHRDGTMYMKLTKYIYGLKQAAHKFAEHLKAFLLRHGFTQSIADECLFIKKCGNYLIIIATHVDDLLVLAPTGRDLDNGIDLLKSTWDVSRQEGNELSYIGLSIHRDRVRKTCIITQEKFLKDIIDKYKDCIGKDRSTPMDLSYTNAIQNDDELCNRNEYLSIVMSLMYLARFTRVDILFAAVFLATKSERPTITDLRAAYKVITYLKSTGNVGLIYHGTDITVSVYVDASFGIHEDARGHTSIIITLGSAPIFTRSVKQKILALHSTDAEVIAVTEALTYVLWLRVLLAELGYILEAPIPIHQDNQSAILIYNGRGKFKRKAMPADIGTKPLTGHQILKFMEKLSVYKL